MKNLLQRLGIMGGLAVGSIFSGGCADTQFYLHDPNKPQDPGLGLAILSAAAGVRGTQLGAMGNLQGAAAGEALSNVTGGMADYERQKAVAEAQRSQIIVNTQSQQQPVYAPSQQNNSVQGPAAPNRLELEKEAARADYEKRIGQSIVDSSQTGRSPPGLRARVVPIYGLEIHSFHDLNNNGTLDLAEEIGNEQYDFPENSAVVLTTINRSSQNKFFRFIVKDGTKTILTTPFYDVGPSGGRQNVLLKPGVNFTHSGEYEITLSDNEGNIIGKKIFTSNTFSIAQTAN